MANPNNSTNATSSATPLPQSLPIWLVAQERRLLANFRAMRASAKDMLLDVSEEIADALPDNVEGAVTA